MDHGGLKGPKHQLLSQGGIGVLASTMSIECNLTESGTFYIGREGGGEVVRSMENMGPWRKMDQRLKTLQDIGCFYSTEYIVNVYLTHTANLYMQTRISFSFSFKKTRTRGVQRASRHSIILGSRVSTLQQTFPDDED